MPLRVLASEGSSTSAREAVTILGLSGHHVEICDPSPWCLARFSRFVKKLHRCPPLRDNPRGYLAFIEALVASGQFDVLLPTHEQGFLFARVQASTRRQGRAGVAVVRQLSHRAQQGRLQPIAGRVGVAAAGNGDRHVGERVARGSSLSRRDQDLDRHGQPRRLVRAGCAGVGRKPLRELVAADAFADEVLVQDFVVGTTEKAQSVFCHGELSAFMPIGGSRSVSAAARRSRRASVGRRCARCWKRSDERLAWHGALSIDYLMPDGDATPLLIDCNPRLVEPMSACLAGTDLVGLLLEVSRGEMPAHCRQAAQACARILRCRRCSGSQRASGRGARSCTNAGASRAAEVLTPIAAKK